ncbi:MAG: TSCPD domain-containing protein, partial [Bacteroidaceae bacterium]|nr:TSCPD domain-containing protein [Bacteroidaceae bacterium]
RCGSKSTSCPDQLCRALEQLNRTAQEDLCQTYTNTKGANGNYPFALLG